MIKNRKGVSILVASFLMITLGLMVVVIVAKTVVENRVSLQQLHTLEALYGAEAFVERGLGALVDDAGGSTNTYQTASPTQQQYAKAIHLDAYDNRTSGSVTNPDRAYVYNYGDSSSYAAMAAVNDVLTLGDFQQRANLCGARIKSVSIFCKLRDTVGGGTATVALDLTTSGDPVNGPWTNIANLSVTSTSWTTYSNDVSSYIDTWGKISNAWIRLKITALTGASNQVYVDYAALVVTVGLDASTEPWATGDFIASYPLSLDRVQTPSSYKISIQDEAGKININYASQILLSNFFSECGFGGDAATAAQDVVNYRSSQKFKTIEEIKAASLTITAARFDTIKDYLTVHSWVNDWLARPTSQRPPININTAAQTVLESMFDPYLGDTKSLTLATQIITQRSTQPFSNMVSSYTYSSDSDYDSNCFAIFVDSLGSPLTAYDKQVIKEIIDGASYNVSPGSTWDSTIFSTYEGCFYSNAYLVKARAERKMTGTMIKKAQAHLKEVAGFSYDYSSHLVSQTLTIKMPTYYSEANPKPYWRQIY